eukprot:TRINITY_DN29068_c0_g1_i1.p1 TRINITY_DN29068_c0_g1~~TRINITY_DN29068_c0_g1_i1.p1  ORF type:complete len:1028 (-),score=129.52 TRINITY_DN29068_c0_g1_i1:256-3339(-)
MAANNPHTAFLTFLTSAALSVNFAASDGVVSANLCESPAFQHHWNLAYGFYVGRASIDVDAPGSYEDPVFGFPEVNLLSQTILTNLLEVAILCPVAALVEVLLDVERHLSLLARSRSAAELRGNATIACQRWEEYSSLVVTSAFATAVQDALSRGAYVHAFRTWNRIGLMPARLCPVLAAQTADAVDEGVNRDSDVVLPFPFDLNDVEVHFKCALRVASGFKDSGGCHVPSFATKILGMLPAEAIEAIGSRLPSAENDLGCGDLQTGLGQEPEDDWRREGSGHYSGTCASPFLTFWPGPLPAVTKCKYCAASSLLSLRPGDRVLDFGAGCGLGAAWLASAFGARVTALDVFPEHLAGATEAAEGVGASLAGACRGDIATLASFPDASFDAVMSNSALTSRHFAVQCAVLRSHLVRLLRPGGVLWWGDFDSPPRRPEFHGSKEELRQCLQSLTKAKVIAYEIVSELDTFGATETWGDSVLSLFLVRLPLTISTPPTVASLDVTASAVVAGYVAEAWRVAGAGSAAAAADFETLRMASIYGCPAARAAGFKSSAKAIESIVAVSEIAARLAPVSATSIGTNAAAGAAWAAAAMTVSQPWEAGPSFWPCTEARLTAVLTSVDDGALAPRPRRLAPQLWSLEKFASEAESEYLFDLATRWRDEAVQGLPDSFAEREAEMRRLQSDVWFDDVIVPTGVDSVLDSLEDRLETLLGMPRAHSDPWHILRYEAGFRGYSPHTDCNHSGYNPENNRFVTALLWLSPRDNFVGEGNHTDDGATVFPRHDVRIRLDAGGLVLYSSVGAGPSGECLDDMLHFAAPLAKARGHKAKVILQKWYYMRPVEPSSPETPLIFCERESCKRFLMAPSGGLGSKLVQHVLTAIDQEAQSSSSMAEFLRGGAARLLVTLEREVAASSLGHSAHWRALLLAGYFESSLAPHGLVTVRQSRVALALLRASLRRCPVCEDVVSRLTLSLCEEGLFTDEVDARESLALARRMAFMGAKGATSLTRLAAARLESFLIRERSDGGGGEDGDP